MTIAMILIVLAVILAIISLFLVPHATRLLAAACVLGFIGVLLTAGMAVS